MKMTNEEYKRYAERRAPRSQTAGDLLRAFLYGGAICCVGQGLIDFFTARGLDAETAGTAASIALIFLGAALTALGVYDDLARRAGAGTLVPITGFANGVAAPAIEFKTEGWITGLAVKMFSIAGPVLVFGAAASAVYGGILCLTK
jgi:stage V sporulation protein AC